MSQSSWVPLTDASKEHMHYSKKNWEGLPTNSSSFHEHSSLQLFSSSQRVLTASNHGSRWHTFNTSFNNPPCSFRQTELQQITRQQIFGGIMPEEASYCQDNLNMLGAQ